MPWPVGDCPAHPCCALTFQGGTLCLACGQRVLDTIDGPACIPAPQELIDEARAAWQVNTAVRTFTQSAREKYPQTGADDDDEGAADRPARA